MIDIIKKYGKQKSTWFGFFKIAAAVGQFTLAPEMQDQIADAGVKVVEAGLAVLGTYSVVKDTSK